jgi:hypothetical protein
MINANIRNNIHNTLFCYALKKMTVLHFDIVQDFNQFPQTSTECEFFMHNTSLSQPEFSLQISLNSIEDEYEKLDCDINILFELRFDKKAKEFDIRLDGNKYICPQLDSQQFIEIFDRLYLEMNTKIENLFDFIDHWESDVAHSDRMFGMEQEKQIEYEELTETMF